jgi:hypothetical protein
MRLALNKKASELRRKGFVVSGGDREELEKALAESPLHIGHGARSANEALEQLIENDVFGLDLKSRTVVAHVENVGRFDFSVGNLRGA